MSSSFASNNRCLHKFIDWLTESILTRLFWVCAHGATCVCACCGDTQHSPWESCVRILILTGKGFRIFGYFLLFFDLGRQPSIQPPASDRQQTSQHTVASGLAAPQHAGENSWACDHELWGCYQPQCRLEKSCDEPTTCRPSFVSFFFSFSFL